jgi:hypothetical protein
MPESGDDPADGGRSLAQWLQQCDAPTEDVAVRLLLPGDSPRLAGEMGSHAALMVTASDLPPLVVHRPSMKIIDGMHRLSAARLRNQDTVEARFFDGTADEAPLTELTGWFAQL